VYFEDLIVSDSPPGKNDLVRFLDGVSLFFCHVLENSNSGMEFSFLWTQCDRKKLNISERDLRLYALTTYSAHIKGHGIDVLKGEIYEIEDDCIEDHGLAGDPLLFKFKVLYAVEQRRLHIRGYASKIKWFKKMVDAIDAVLDSIVSVTGTGGTIKEFKDALRALA